MDKVAHQKVIDEVLGHLNQLVGQPFILKGGTALKKCYGLKRFSEDIDLDASQKPAPPDLLDILEVFCQEQGYAFRKAKDTEIVKRGFIAYDAQSAIERKPLKVELSLRNASILEETTQYIDGVRVYTLDRLCQMKASAFMSRDRLRDLYDLTFVITQYFDQLSETSRTAVHDALEYKGLEQLDYLLRTQDDELVDKDELETRFLESFEKVGLILPTASSLKP